MRKAAAAIGIGSAFLLLASALAPAAAHAGVPRSCVHPHADRLECQSDTRRVMDAVLPSARVGALRQQVRDLGRVTNRSDRERNLLLRAILRELSRPQPRR